MTPTYYHLSSTVKPSREAIKVINLDFVLLCHVGNQVNSVPQHLFYSQNKFLIADAISFLFGNESVPLSEISGCSWYFSVKTESRRCCGPNATAFRTKYTFGSEAQQPFGWACCLKNAPWIKWNHCLSLINAPFSINRLWPPDWLSFWLSGFPKQITTHSSPYKNVTPCGTNVCWVKDTEITILN